MKDQRVIIVGGGFAGVKCARVLGRSKAAEVVLFSRENHMVFQPLLADVAGSALNPRAVAAPLRQMLKGVRCRSEEVTDIDLDAGQVRFLGFHGEARSMAYDHLVIAVGNRVDLSRVPGMASHALPLKSIGDAIAMRARVMERLEQADAADDPELRRWLASFIVIGGGFSGVEVAGEINDLIRHARKYYPQISASDLKVTLIHSRDQILPEVSSRLRDFALQRMRRAGVDFLLKARAAAVTRKGVRLQDDRFVEGATAICTVGNTPHEFVQRLQVPKERGRLKTNPDMSLIGYANIWAIGDCAWVPNAQDGEISPPTAQFGERQGGQVARNILARLKGRDTRPFRFKPVGAAAGIGSRSGVAELYGIRVSGFLAWWLWRSAFLVKLPSFLQKIKVGIDWAWEVIFPRDINYFRGGRTQPVTDSFFAAGETIVDADECERRIYVIEEGECELVEERSGTSDRVLLVLGRGEIIGRQTLSGFGADRQIRLRARTNTEVIALSDDFLEQVSGLLKPVQKLIQDATLSHDDFWKNIPNALTHLEAVSCADVMSPLPNCRVERTATVIEAFQALRDSAQPFALVCDSDGLLQGMVTRTDLIGGFKHGPQTRVESIMTRDPLCASKSDPASAAATTMQDHGLKWLPVIERPDRRKPVGVAVAEELVAHVLDKLQPGSLPT